MLISLVLAGSGQGLFPVVASCVRWTVFGFLCGFILYCLFQFAITILSISQVGEPYIIELRNEAKNEPGS